MTNRKPKTVKTLFRAETIKTQNYLLILYIKQTGHKMVKFLKSQKYP